MNTKRILAATGMTVVLSLSLTACFGNGGDDSKSKAQAKEQSQAANAANALIANQPVHTYQYSQLRQNLQELEDAQANGAVTTTFFLNMGLADPVMSCPSIGAPIASTTQMTNPMQTERHGSQYDGGNVTINQMDPTGVYTGDSTGTYIMCVQGDGSVEPVYWEGFVMTAFGSATWNKTTHSMEMNGKASFKFSGVKK